MIVNGKTLLELAPIKNMLSSKESNGIVSHGLSEAGYDIRIKQNITFSRSGDNGEMYVASSTGYNSGAVVLNACHEGRFIIASAIEEFDMPPNLVGVVHDKSTWARKGLSVFNTVIEPGWKGFLTLELVYHGDGDLVIPAGSGIAQVIFTKTTDSMLYNGKYQNQEDKPVPAINSPIK